MYVFHRRKFLLEYDEPTLKHSKEVVISTLDVKFQNVLQNCISGIVNLFDSVKFKGLEFEQGCVVVTSFADDLFNFSCIQHGYFVGDELLLLCQVLETVCFNIHYNCYEVVFTEDFHVLRIDELLDSKQLGLYKVKNLSDCWLVPLKHYLRIPEFQL